jgi:radical SAM protein with 4Fe4S-binding SPASM domain
MITAYVKPTNGCNVGCTHCYLPEAVRANKSRMTDDVLLDTAQFLKDMMVRGRHQGAHVLWHGGEPLTISPDWFYRAGAMLDVELPGHSESMQTSLIPLRREHLPLFKDRLNSFVGSSVDFSQRQIKGSVEAYHALWMDKVDMARNAGIKVVAGVVPTRNELGREEAIVDWFVSRDFDAFNIDRYNAYGTYFPDRPSNLEHSYFLMGLFDALMEQMGIKGRAPLVGAIRSAITGVLHGVGGDRWGGSCQSDFIVVEPDGSLNNCPDKAPFEETFGNVSGGFNEFAKSRFRRKWIRVQNLDHKQSHCFGCENQSFCQSGCPITPNGAPEGEDECSGYRTMLTHVRRYASSSEGRATLDAYLDQAHRNPDAAAATTYGGSPAAGACLQ